MEEFYIEYYIENNYEVPVRKANFQLLVIPESNQQQKVTDLKISAPKTRNHISRKTFLASISSRIM
jgi:hypothetical protein